MTLSFIAISSLISIAAANGPVPVSRSGLAGINGFTFYNPYCAHGCYRSFSPFVLSCSEVVNAGGHTTANSAAHNLAICRSSNFPFLSSIAWCIHLYCPSNVRASTIEAFWQTEITGDVNILPAWSYGEVMANISSPPTVVATDENLIETTMLTTYSTWKATQDTLEFFFRETAQESYYGLCICLTAFALPILITFLRYPPFMNMLTEQIKPWTYQSIIGSYHDKPLPYLLGHVPTVGQTLYIAVIFLLNIVCLSVGYKTLYPRNENQWYENHNQELMAYFMWRTGVLAFCNMPVLFLFSSRNNILLWLSNWSHSTYMLLHRWIARIFLLHLILHSILALILYRNTGSLHKSQQTKWWIWGCVATVACVILVLSSVLVFRKQAYELFFVTHFAMAVICLVGCWYHVWYGYENTFGYETWLYATIAVWLFDRLSRLLRVWKMGIRRAEVTELGPNIVRIDVPVVRWSSVGHCVYVYFPTLNPLRPWSNHPFSAIPTMMLSEPRFYDKAKSELQDDEKLPIMKIEPGSTVNSTASSEASTTAGLTLLLRKRAGMTVSLKARSRLLTFLEGPYPTMFCGTILQSDRLLLVGGGIGITGLLPLVQIHKTVKLLYSVKTADQQLIQLLGTLLDNMSEKEIGIGRRLELDGMLEDEAKFGWSKISIVVCGPAEMCDDVREIIARLSRTRASTCSFELVVDSFSW